MFVYISRILSKWMLVFVIEKYECTSSTCVFRPKLHDLPQLCRPFKGCYHHTLVRVWRGWCPKSMFCLWYCVMLSSFFKWNGRPFSSYHTRCLSRELRDFISQGCPRLLTRNLGASNYWNHAEEVRWLCWAAASHYTWVPSESRENMGHNRSAWQKGVQAVTHTRKHRITVRTYHKNRPSSR